MADEIRRSGRANKGHHTKHQDDEQPVTTPKPKTKGKDKAKAKSDKKGGKNARAQSTQTPEQEEEDEDEDDPDAIIRCVCGNQVDNGEQMICCEQCDAWQHVRCLGLKEGKHWDTATYFCEQCKPENHVELVAAIARGEKPWEKTKGSKKKKGSAKPKSARPSDVKPEVEKKVSTPQPPATPKEAPKETPAPTAEPTNGHTAPVQVTEKSKAASKTSKPPAESPAPQTKKETPPQPEPQSPREKRRRDTIAEKENAAPKRRKSSAQHEKPAQAQEPAKDPSTLPDKQKTIVLKLIDELSKTVKEASKSRGYRIPDGQTPSSLATQLALQVHHFMIVNLGEPSDNQSPYSIQLRSIMFNIKKNSVLVDRLLSGSLPAEGLATMAAEDMASEDKQREYAQMREAAEKQMTLVEETGPRLRKTHKGEEIVGEDQMDVDPQPAAPEPQGSVPEEQQPLDPAPTHSEGSPTVELPEDIDGHGPLTVDTASAQAPVSKPAANFDVQAIFNKVRSPQGNQQFLPRRQSSIQEQPPEGPGVDADIDRLLKDEDNDVMMTDLSSSDPTIVWQGALDMQSLGPFDAVARFVAGGDLGQVMPWHQLLSPTLPIQGRIENAKGDEYIKGLAASDTHDVGVLAVTPVTEEGRAVMDRLFEYFWPRKRWGVVPVDKLGNEAMRDLYVIPLEAGGTNLPPFLELLEYCTIETPRRDNMILLALVAKLPEPSQQSIPQHPFNQYPAGEIPQPVPPTNGSTNGPSLSPATNPHGPQFSPLQSAFPSNATYGNPFATGTPVQPFNGQTPQAEAGHNIPATPQLNSKAADIFGPYISAPAVIASLNHQPDMPEQFMQNLRHILDEVPAARDNLQVLLDHMTKKNEAKNANNGGTKVDGLP
ncbi:SPOC domain-containing protein [Lophiotrema nucula]|uniref:Transcription factor BYE1 n=1 Tax=Lophiotrema nucula TaxID=690887 RepID=A0A6A5ZCL5_9PLEO|nr:SPOC domain-containing protein [Lophiotrema nucula]